MQIQTKEKMNVLKTLHGVCAVHALVLTVSGKPVHYFNQQQDLLLRDDPDPPPDDPDDALLDEEEDAAVGDVSAAQWHTFTTKTPTTMWHQLKDMPYMQHDVQEEAATEPLEQEAQEVQDDLKKGVQVLTKVAQPVRRFYTKQGSSLRRRHRRSSFKAASSRRSKKNINKVLLRLARQAAPAAPAPAAAGSSSEPAVQQNEASQQQQSAESDNQRHSRSRRSASTSQSVDLAEMYRQIQYESAALKIKAQLMLDLYSNHESVQLVVSQGFGSSSYLASSLLAAPGCLVPVPADVMGGTASRQESLNVLLQSLSTYRVILHDVMKLELTWACRHHSQSCDKDAILRHAEGYDQVFYAELHQLAHEYQRQLRDFINVAKLKMSAMGLSVNVNESPSVNKLSATDELAIRNYALTALYAIAQQTANTDNYITSLVNNS